MGTAPGGDAMTTRFQRATEAGALAPVPRPWARWLAPGEVAEFAAKRKHCETRGCRNPVGVTTWRYWRSSELGGQVLVTEHFVCSEHGADFAARHHIGVDPAGEVTVRHLSDAEMLAFRVEHRHCDWAACQIPATWIFTESFTVRGEPRSDEDLSCDRHVRAFAAQFHIAPPPDEGGAR